MRYRSEVATVVRIEAGRYLLHMGAADTALCARCGMCSRSSDAEAAPELLVPAGSLPWQPQPGDAVRVLVPDVSSSLAAAIVFGMPLGGGLLGLLVALQMSLADLSVLGLGVAGFAGGWLAAYLGWGRRHVLQFEPAAKDEQP